MDKNETKVIALIVAGGKGTRMGQPLPKQYLVLAGQSVLSHTLETFDRVEWVSRIVLVVPADDSDYCRDNILSKIELTKPLTLTTGGQSRQESVQSGLREIEDPDGFVAIHDAVRPFVPIDATRQCLEAARVSGAAILAMPCVDTLKKTAEKADNNSITATLPRQNIWLAQTPQIFKVNLIQKAHQAALNDNLTATDDAQLVEQLGAPVTVVPGSRYNIKITTPEDLAFAESLVKTGMVIL